MIQVAITNESTKMADADVQKVCAALQRQVSGDFAPLWNVDATVQFFPKGKQPKDWWWLVLLDTSDQAGALGYHDVTNAGLPLGKAFVGSDIQYGYSPSVTVSHELLEMLGDPQINRVFQMGSQQFGAYEACDACEADQYGYTIDGVQVSDFVTPEWFGDFSGKGVTFDFKKHVKKPMALLPGGYIGIWTPGAGWTQKTAEGEAPHVHARARVGSRRERRRVFAEGERHTSTVTLQTQAA